MPAPDEVFTTTPPPWRTICAISCFMQMKVPRRLMFEDAVPLLELDLVKRRRLVLDAGVVERAVDAAEGLDGLCHRGLDLFRLRHVAGDRQHLAAGGLHELARSPQAPAASGPDGDARPFGREGHSGRAADAAGGSGDEGGLAFEAFGSWPLTVSSVSDATSWPADSSSAYHSI